METPKVIQGDFAWVTMALGILAYDTYSIKTKRTETMSSAIWRSLRHPGKGLFLTISWAILTHHLFGNSRARNAYSGYFRKG